MGSAAAVVEISSDDDDVWRTPGAGKRKSADGSWRTPGAGKQPLDGGWRTPGAGQDKSPDGGLEWAEKLLAEDCDAIGEDFEDSEAMQEFWDSLMDETNIVPDEKKNSVDEREKKSLGDADDDDYDCVILDGDPEKAVAVAKEEGPRRDASEDELQIIAEKGELACRDFPHPRHLCVSFPFSTSSHASHCSMCHCYVCDSPAPCAFWGIGTVLNDHCHATDKDAKWKKLRQIWKHKSQQTPKLGAVQNFFQSSSTTPSSQPSANVMIPYTGRYPVSSIVSQNQQMHQSIMIPQNTRQGIFQPRAPSPMPRTTVPSNRSKRARAAPPVYTPSDVNNLQPSAPCYGPMRPAFPRGLQKAQVTQGDKFWSFPPLPPLGAPTGSQGYRGLPSSYPQVPPNCVVGTGVQLSRCTSLSTQGTQRPQGPSPDTRRLKDALTHLAYELGVPDYNTDPPLGQQSARNQSLHSNQLLAQAKASQGGEINRSYVAGQVPLQIRLSGGHKSSNHASGSIVLSSGSIQIKQPLCQLNSQSSLVPNETTPSTFFRSLPWIVDGK